METNQENVMAFGGAAVIQQISDNLVRITGLTLANGAAGTIGLFGGGGEVSLPDGFNPTAYDRGIGGGDLPLSALLDITVKAAAGSAANALVRVAKADGPFLATLTNDAAAGSGALEIYVRYH